MPLARARVSTCPGGAILDFDPKAAPQVVEHLARRIPARARHRPDPRVWVVCDPFAEAARWLLGEWAEVEVLEADDYAGALAALAPAGVR